MQMVKSVILGAAAGVIAITAAQSADIPVKAPRAVAAPYNWTGFYLGVHGGYGWGESHTLNINGGAANPAGEQNTSQPDGGIGGVQGGLNYHVNWLLLGIEADYSWSAIDSHRTQFSDFVANRLSNTHTELKWLATVTGRLGVTHGNWLFYAKGGFGWGDFETNSRSINTLNGATTVITSGGETRTAWLVGGGFEWAFGGNWSAKVEYNYLDFGTDRVYRDVLFTSGATPDPLIRDVDTHLHLIKFGVNYRFGWGGPVTARY